MVSHKEYSDKSIDELVLTHYMMSDEEFRKYERLIHKFARKYFGKLLSAGLTEHDYEDVFQEVAVWFLMAKQKFRESLGYQFSTYACSAANKNFSGFIGREIRKNFNKTYLEDLSGDDDPFSWEELVPGEDNELSPEMKGKIAEEKMASLSTQARTVVKELIDPSDDITRMHFARLEYSRMARKCGGRVPRVSQDIDFNFIFQHYKWKTPTRVSVLKELMDVFEVKF